MLRERLAAAPERQRFLLGGVTVCGMVPQRAIPFRVIAVLGLNDGEFPRTASDAGLDLMQRHRRLGDRDVRSDDRYLFLETVMAAREVLHLSYIGEGVRDGKPRNPAAPLAELLQFLDEQAGLRGVDAHADDARGDDQSVRRPWRIKHPLQPFDIRYFNGADPRLFSFDTGFAGMVRGAAAGPFMDVPPDGELPPRAEPIPLRDVHAYFRDPARQLLAQQLHIRLDALDNDRLQESEPLETRLSALDQVARRLFFNAVGQGTFALPERPPAWLQLSGMLPSGRIGLDAWTAERDKVDTLLMLACDHPLFAGALPQRQPQALSITVGDYTVEGVIERVYATDEGLWLFEAYPGKKRDALSFKEHLPLFLDWALLRLSTEAATSVRVAVLAEDGDSAFATPMNAWNDRLVGHAGDEKAVRTMLDELARRVSALLAIWCQAQQRPAAYFPRTSWDALKDNHELAQTTWQGVAYGNTGERDYAPGYARLLAAEASFEPGQPDYDALRALAQQLERLIDLSPDPGASA